MTPQPSSALVPCAALKHARPGLTIVLGGAHVEASKDDVFSMATTMGFAIHGEGQLPMLERCPKLRDHGLREGYRSTHLFPLVQTSRTSSRAIRKPAR